MAGDEDVGRDEDRKVCGGLDAEDEEEGREVNENGDRDTGESGGGKRPEDGPAMGEGVLCTGLGKEWREDEEVGGKD